MNRDSLYFTGPYEVERRPTTFVPTDGEVVVETRVSAISPGTELLIYRGEAPTDLPADEAIDALDGDLSFPVRYGYAAVGDVVATGADVDEAWVGRTVFAFNPHETRFAAHPDDLVPIPEDVSPEAMAMLPSVETATSLVLDGRPRIGERVVVFGAGPVGLCTTALLGSFPLDRLVVVDPLADRRERALHLGADEAVPPEAAAAAVDADGSDHDGADLVYELSGRPEALDAAIDVTGFDSRVVVGSWYGTKRASVDLGTDFHRDRVTIESSQVSTLSPAIRGRWTTERRMATALDRLRAIDVASLVSHRIPFADASVAYHLLDERTDDALQVLLTYP